MRRFLLCTAGAALLVAGCIDLSAISSNELWIVNDSSVAVFGTACIDANPCFEYQIPAGKFVRTGMTLCLGENSRVGISVQSDGMPDAPFQLLDNAIACDGLSAIRIDDDGSGGVLVSIDREFSASESRIGAFTDRN